MLRPLVAAVAALYLLSQPALAQEKHTHGEAAHAEKHDHDDHSHHEGEANGIRTVHAWTRATSDRSALVFVDIENNSDKDIVLTGGETEIADKVELVGFQLKDGEPTYVALPSVPLKAGTKMTLAPNGLALKLDGIKRHLEKGEEFEIEIEFDFGHIEMFAQVEAADARQHSHVGHKH